MKKPSLKRKVKEVQAPQRITNETVAEHRERILAGGRRFKYPLQYERHKLVFNAIVIAIVALLIAAAVGWQQLYLARNTSQFAYRVTNVLPLPIASVDGTKVRYSDYLMRYQASERWLSQKGQLEQSDEDSTRQLSLAKRQILDEVEKDAYAAKLAKELDISVSSSDIDAVIQRSLETTNGKISQDVFDASTLDTLGYGRSEYRHLIRQSLLRQKVSYEIDDTAKKASGELITTLIKNKNDFDKTAKQLDTVELGNSGMVRKNNQDAGLTKAALELKEGGVSDVIKSTTGDGYYVVKLIDLKDTQLSYQYLKVPLTQFEAQFAKIKADNLIKEYIDIPKAETKVIGKGN